MTRLLPPVLLAVILSCCSNERPEETPVATGMLKTRDYLVTLYASQGEPRYAVHSLDGTLLEEDLDMESMVAQFPALGYLKENGNIDWAGLDSGTTPTRNPASR